MIVFARHALARLAERGIAPALAEQIVAAPFMHGPTRDGRHYSAGTVTDGQRRQWLTVIHDPRQPDGSVNVVTVYVGVTASKHAMNEKPWIQRSDARKAGART